MKKIKILVMAFIVFSAVALNIHAAEILTDKVSKGAVGASHSGSGKTLKVMIEKEGKKHTYNLRNDGNADYYPLQMGNGSYKISILENVSGNKFSLLKSENIDVKIANSNDVYLNSIQIINWNTSDPAIVKAGTLKNTNGVYGYVVKNVKYDYDKAKTVKPGYDPVINETFKTNKGICYDYSALEAGMLRSLGVPTKLVKGYAKGVDGYHAWNEIFIDGKWVVVDSTFDAAMWGGSAKQSMSKKASDYQKVYEY